MFSYDWNIPGLLTFIFYYALYVKDSELRTLISTH